MSEQFQDSSTDDEEYDLEKIEKDKMDKLNYVNSRVRDDLPEQEKQIVRGSTRMMTNYFIRLRI